MAKVMSCWHARFTCEKIDFSWFPYKCTTVRSGTVNIFCIYVILCTYDNFFTKSLCDRLKVNESPTVAKLIGYVFLNLVELMWSHCGPCALAPSLWAVWMSVCTGNELSLLTQHCCCEVEQKCNWKGSELASKIDLENWKMQLCAFVCSHRQ